VRIALVSPYDLGVPGGVQSHVRHLAAALVAAGDEVVLVGPGVRGVHRPAAPASAGGAAAEVWVGATRGVPFNGAVAPIALGPGAARRTVRLLRALAPDVVHVHEPLVPVVGPAAVLGSPAPVVLTLHAWSDSDRAYRLARPLGRSLLARAGAVLAVSPAAAGYHAGALGTPAEQFAVVPNGVDVDRFADARRRFAATQDAPPSPDGTGARGERASDRPPSVVFVGRLEPRKGVLVLARAYRRLLRTHPDVHLTVIGDGPQRAALAALLDGVPPGQVELAGRVEGDRLAAALAGADVAVAPALGGESFGIVLLEAMAAGTAVVASAIPGYRGVVTDGDDAVLVPPGDDAALAVALAGLLDDSERRARMVAAGTETAARHDWPVVARALRGHYLAVQDRDGSG